MARHSSALKLDEVKYRASVEPRKMIRPTVDVKVTNASERRTVVESARRIIAEHRGVLLALKDR